MSSLRPSSYLSQFVLLLLVSILGSIGCSEKREFIRAAVPSHWGSLHPALQDNYYASVILESQFDPLVTMGKNGVLQPLGASSWSVSSDFKLFKFKIDSSRKFPNGDKLTSFDYKRSWSDGLKMNPASHNSSLGDVLYKLKGFSSGGNGPTLAGVKTPDSETLILEFDTPFRKALDELKGARFAAFKEEAGELHGSGAYIIREKTPEFLILEPNPQSIGSHSRVTIELSVVKAVDVKNKIETNQLDVFLSGKAHSSFKQIGKDAELAVVYGQESAHAALHLNGKNGRFFSNDKLRIAFQYLVWDSFKMSPENKYFDIPGFRFDFQSLLPLQPGRMAKKDVEQLILKGKPYVEELKRASLKKPLIFFYDRDSHWLYQKLKVAGVVFSVKSRDITTLGAKVLDEAYKNHESDVLTLSFSVSNGDPDGIYHILGRKGAIFSPIVYRPRVADILELNRELLNPSALDPAYRKLNKAIFEEVPFVHMGFKASVAVFSPSRVNLDETVLNRNDSHLHAFSLK